MKKLFFLFFIFLIPLFCSVELGVDRFFQEKLYENFKGKKVALIINHTSCNKELESTLKLFIKYLGTESIKAIFSPEHGFAGFEYAGEKVDGQPSVQGIPIYSLHGPYRRPSDEMLKGIDYIVYDIQEIGARSYTYATTLYYVMEEAAKKKISVYVLDRPNPINGVTVDGPLLQEKFRSFIGYINVPYCHGMTIGELANFFNDEYQIHCSLKIIEMKGWNRQMTYKDTGLTWIPTSPNIPEADTPLYCLSTGILGELDLVSIGIGYTLPFKVVGAPWIKKEIFAEKLNAYHLPGVHFLPFSFKPFSAPYKMEECQGVKICITDPLVYKPLSVQYLIIGMLKALYPNKILEMLENMKSEKISLFCKANGNGEILQFLKTERYPAYKMIHFQEDKIEQFKLKRKPYLLYSE
jgi:uncharacterized protein YbbC (DUF1343 family)